MSRDKQIEEMAKDLEYEIEYSVYHDYIDDYTEVEFDYKKTAENIVNKGYRKASDIAREIFEEADKIFMATCLSLETYKAWCELKKKYTESSNEITGGVE